MYIGQHTTYSIKCYRCNISSIILHIVTVSTFTWLVNTAPSLSFPSFPALLCFAYLSMFTESLCSSLFPVGEELKTFAARNPALSFAARQIASSPTGKQLHCDWLSDASKRRDVVGRPC